MKGDDEDMKMHRITIGYILSRIILIAFALIGIIPFILTIYFSLRNDVELATNFWGLPDKIHWENYAAAFKGISMPMFRSITVSLVTIIGLLVISSFTTYVFARMKFKGKETIYTLYTIVLMIPGVLTITPMFMIINKLHMLGNWWALILPYIAWWQVMGINIMRTSYEEIPEVLFESARIDGAGDFWCFVMLALPLTKASMITVGITALLSYYNDYIWPTLVLDGSRKMFSMFVVELGSGNSSDFGITSAAYVIGSMPLIVIMSLCMKQYLQGTMVGAVKG